MNWKRELLAIAVIGVVVGVVFGVIRSRQNGDDPPPAKPANDAVADSGKGNEGDKGNEGGPADVPASDVKVPADLTYTKHIAPIVLANCATCHRPGQSGPFNLVTYEDVSKRAKQIATVTKRRIMPPWLPEQGHNHFIGERYLTPEQIKMLDVWAAAGAPQGNAADLPPTPTWPGEWTLGEPDLVLDLPEGYTLPAEGRDVYRNFVVPTKLDKLKYVKAVELNLYGSKVVHHLFLLVDRGGHARREDRKDDAPGYPGMDPGGEVSAPDGYFVSWQPGKRPEQVPEGMGWRLDRGADLVVQMHLRPSGKPEPVKAKIGLHFADKPPTNFPFRMLLRETGIEIPADEKDYVIKEEYTLPVNVNLLAVLPHVHYLGKELKAHAELPDGKTKSIIHIQNWDFKWQGDYRYERPVFLPKGSRIVMEFHYDNSEANPNNPNHPPKIVRYGPQSSDEMGELWLQMLPETRTELALLASDFLNRYGLPDVIRRNENLLRHDPKNVGYLTRLAGALITQGKVDEAMQYLDRALKVDSGNAQAFYFRAVLAARRGKVETAISDLELVVQLDPEHSQAYNNLGWLLLLSKKPKAAEVHLRKAVELNPNDALARVNLAQLLIQKEDLEGAIAELKAAIEADPDNGAAAELLRKLRVSQ